MLRHVLQAPQVQRAADVFAVSCSSLCAVHCLATPVLLTLLPVLGATILGGEAFHVAILWLILPTSLAAVLLGCWRHKDLYVVLLCGLGLAVIVVAATAGHELIGDTGETIVTLAGSVLLIAGHVRNFRLCRKDACAT
jgi:hypothetical protein